jgi:hypothetical protein
MQSFWLCTIGTHCKSRLIEINRSYIMLPLVLQKDRMTVFKGTSSKWQPRRQ